MSLLPSSALIPPHILQRMAEADRKKLGKDGVLPAEHAQVATAKTEKLLQQQLEGLLRRNGIVCIRQRMDRKSTIAVGLPDIMFAVHGNAIAWEVKLPGRKPRPEQAKMHDSMRDLTNGWTVMVIHSYDEGRDFLRALGLNA